MKPTVIDPKTTTRASAFDLWMNAPNPMVTFSRRWMLRRWSGSVANGTSGAVFQGLQEIIFALEGYRGI